MKMFAYAAIAACFVASPAMAQSLVGTNVTFAQQLSNVTITANTRTVVDGTADLVTFGSTSGFTADLNANSLTVDFFAPPPTRFSSNTFLPGASLLLSSSTFDFAALISGVTITTTGNYNFTPDRVQLGSDGMRFDIGGLDYTDASGFTATFASVTTPSAVPEPATWAMMLIGFGAMGVSLRRRKQVGFMQVA